MVGSVNRGLLESPKEQHDCQTICTEHILGKEEDAEVSRILNMTNGQLKREQRGGAWLADYNYSVESKLTGKLNNQSLKWVATPNGFYQWAAIFGLWESFDLSKTELVSSVSASRAGDILWCSIVVV